MQPRTVLGAGGGQKARRDKKCVGHGLQFLLGALEIMSLGREHLKKDLKEQVPLAICWLRILLVTQGPWV